MTRFLLASALALGSVGCSAPGEGAKGDEEGNPETGRPEDTGGGSDDSGHGDSAADSGDSARGGDSGEDQQPDGDGDGSPDGEDCAPADDTVHPGAAEHCDGRDEDCDDEVDEDAVDAAPVYRDLDEDGWGRWEVGAACFVGSLESFLGGDCTDTNPDVHPEAVESCSAPNEDRDCDGIIARDDPDLQDPSRCWGDADGDGHGDPTAGPSSCCLPESGLAGDDLDCDDTDASVFIALTWEDVDGDGYGAGKPEERCTSTPGRATMDGDCDDLDAAVSPAAVEVCGDGIDQDCNGTPDEIDGDGDGWADCLDCEPTDPLVHPDATESCDGRDEDCDGLVDDDAWDGLWVYADADGDGSGGAEHWACAVGEGETTRGGDCDDANDDVYPAHPEACVTLDDDNCDGSVNEPGAVGCVDAYLDEDGDGWGIVATGWCLCEPGVATALQGGDCDDLDAEVHLGAIEDCATARDEDCDGDGSCTGPALVPVSWVGGTPEGWGTRFRFDDEESLWVQGEVDWGPADIWRVDGPVGRGRATAATEVVFSGTPALSPGFALGDLDGDGINELAVGRPESGPPPEAGLVEVFYGSGFEPRWESNGGVSVSSALDRVGESLGGIADLGGDGAPDLLVGIPGGERGGGACITNPIPGTWVGATACLYSAGGTGDAAGRAFDGERDLDGDGQVDLFADLSYSRLSPGPFVVVLGPMLGDVATDDADWVATSADFDGTVHAAALLDDLQDDGLPDVWVASTRELAVYPEARAGAEGRDRSLELPVGAESRTPRCVVADLNGDAELDVAWSDAHNRHGAENDGGLELWYGPLDWGGSEAAADWSLTGSDLGFGVGLDLMSGPDLDEDGFPDLYVSSRSHTLLPEAGGVISVLPSGRSW